jgi:hypothetical protein
LPPCAGTLAQGGIGSCTAHSTPPKQRDTARQQFGIGRTNSMRSRPAEPARANANAAPRYRALRVDPLAGSDATRTRPAPSRRGRLPPWLACDSPFLCGVLAGSSEFSWPSPRSWYPPPTSDLRGPS